MRPAALLSAALLAASAIPWPVRAGAETVSVEQAGPDQRRAAQKTFEAGDGLYESGRFAEALTAFRASHALVASPNSRLMIARCLRELARFDEAYVELEATVRDAEASGGRYAETAAAAHAEMDAVRARLAYIVVEAPSDTSFVEFSIGEQHFTAADFGKPIPVSPGSVAIALQRANGERRIVRVEVAVQQTQTARLEPERPESKAPLVQAKPVLPPRPVKAPEPSSLKPYAFVAGGVGLAGAAAFGIFGVLNNATYSDLDKSCPDDRCAANRQHDIDAGRRYQTFANIGLAVGIAGVATSVTLFVIAPRKDHSSPEVEAALGPASLRVRATF